MGAVTAAADQNVEAGLDAMMGAMGDTDAPETAPEVIDRGDDVVEGSDEHVQEPEQAAAEPGEAPEEPSSKNAEATQDRPISIPKARLDDEIAKRRALESQLNELKEQVQAQAQVAEESGEAFNYDEAATTLFNSVLDGETADASSYLKSIISNAVTEAKSELRKEIQQTGPQTRAELELADTAKELEAQYPQLNQTSDAFDQELTNEVIELRDAYVTKGYVPADALRKATRYVLSANDVSPQQQEAEPKRARNSLTKNIEAAKQQPAKLHGQSNAKGAEKEYDLDGMSEDEFDALPESVVRRLRGDGY